VTLAAVPQSVGYTFGNWQGDTAALASVNAACTTITMNGNYTIEPRFDSLPVETLTIFSIGNGAVSEPGIGVFTYNRGATVNLVAAPGPDGHFLDWYTGWTGGIGDVADASSANTTITMRASYTISADFTP